jgi:hypothetical protein
MVIPTFQKGAQLAAADLNLAMDSVRRARVLPGVGIKLTETVNGTVVSLKPTRGSSGGTTPEILPWQIINITGEGEPDEQGKYTNYEASVWPGIVSGILPSNLFESGILKKFTFSSTLQKWKAKCLTNGKQITSVQIVVDASDPPVQTLVPSALPAEAWFVFGVTFEGVAYRTLGPGNPSVSFSQAVVTDKTTSPPLGIPGVDRWYNIIF